MPTTSRDNAPFREGDATALIAPDGVSTRRRILRLFPVFGPRLRKHVVYDLTRKLHMNPDELEIHGDDTQMRDFSHVSTVVAAFKAVAARAEFKGETYNVGSGEDYSIRELADSLLLWV